MRAFLGLSLYYRQFIPNFAKIADPLNKLLQKETLFVWNEKCEEAFQKLKELMTIAPVLCFPDFEKPVHLCTDASDKGLGVVLSQETDVEIQYKPGKKHGNEDGLSRSGNETEYHDSTGITRKTTIKGHQ